MCQACSTLCGCYHSFQGNSLYMSPACVCVPHQVSVNTVLNAAAAFLLVQSCINMRAATWCLSSFLGLGVHWMHVLHYTCLPANAANLYAAYKANVMQIVPQLNVMQVSSPSSAANKMLCIRTSGSACIGCCVCS